MIPINEKTTYILFRRGKPEHIASLFEKGEIYINTIDCIREYDENKERSDPNDSITVRKYIGEGEVRFGIPECEIDHSSVPLQATNICMYTDNGEKGNIYCLSGIFGSDLIKSKETHEFKTHTLGQSLIIITNPREFLNRVKEALSKSGFDNIKHGRVEYFSNEYSGNAGIFKKHDYFSYQNEYRIYVPNPANERIIVNIGSMEDIAEIRESCRIDCTFTDNRIKTFLL